MHQTRRDSSTNLPITRKGTKYIARASHHLYNSVPVVIAVRDMLKLAKNAKEVKEMIKNKSLKINGRVVEDYRESLLLFNILEADKTYELSLLSTKKFVFVPVNYKNLRLCKVINKRLLSKGIIQLNLHDGSNVLTKEKINVQDSVYLDFDGKIKKIASVEKDKQVFVMSGKYAGNMVKVSSIDGNKIIIKTKEGSAEIEISAVAAIWNLNLLKIQ